MKKTILFLSIIMIIGFQNLIAQRGTLSIQGVVRDDRGGAVQDSEYPFTFKLYTYNESSDTYSATNWTENLTLPVKNGVYSAVLGASTSFSSAGISFANQYYVGISFNNKKEMEPKIRLSSAPYALAIVGEDNTFPNTGNVGIGTNDPKEALDVNGKVRIGVVGGTRNLEVLTSMVTKEKSSSEGRATIYGYDGIWYSNSHNPSDAGSGWGQKIEFTNEGTTKLKGKIEVLASPQTKTATSTSGDSRTYEETAGTDGFVTAWGSDDNADWNRVSGDVFIDDSWMRVGSNECRNNDDPFIMIPVQKGVKWRIVFECENNYGPINQDNAKIVWTPMGK